jgi:hypothetical protein
MPVYDALDCRQTDSGAFKGLLWVQALEDPEQLIGIFHIETHPVVSNEQHGVTTVLVGASDFNFCLRTRAGELHSVGN